MMKTLISVFILSLAASACRGTSGDNGSPPSADLDGDGFSLADGDCNDEDPEINPDADEVCDAVDNDCDTYTDSHHDSLQGTVLLRVRCDPTMCEDDWCDCYYGSIVCDYD